MCWANWDLKTTLYKRITHFTPPQESANMRANTQGRWPFPWGSLVWSKLREKNPSVERRLAQPTHLRARPPPEGGAVVRRDKHPLQSLLTAWLLHLLRDSEPSGQGTRSTALHETRDACLHPGEGRRTQVLPRASACGRGAPRGPQCRPCPSPHDSRGPVPERLGTAPTVLKSCCPRASAGGLLGPHSWRGEAPVSP